MFHSELENSKNIVNVYHFFFVSLWIKIDLASDITGRMKENRFGGFDFRKLMADFSSSSGADISHRRVNCYS